MDIREIEDIIDILHKNHPAFSGTKEQLMYELLSTFEDKCSIAVMKSVLNPLARLWKQRRGIHRVERSLCADDGQATHCRVSGGLCDRHQHRP